MSERNVVVRTGGHPGTTFAIVAVIAIALLTALFMWQPWNITQSSTSHTTVSGPNAGAGSSDTSAGSGTTSNDSTTTTNSTTTGGTAAGH